MHEPRDAAPAKLFGIGDLRRVSRYYDGFIIASMSNNVISCSPTSAIFVTASTPTFNIMAVANQTTPPTRSCGWSWYSASGSTNGNFTITEADGLPVELMEFSVNHPDSDASGDATDSDSEHD